MTSYSYIHIQSRAANPIFFRALDGRRDVSKRYGDTQICRLTSAVADYHTFYFLFILNLNPCYVIGHVHTCPQTHARQCAKTDNGTTLALY